MNEWPMRGQGEIATATSEGDGPQGSLFSGDPEIDEAPGRSGTHDLPTQKQGAADVAVRAGSQKHKLLVAYWTVETHGHTAGLTDEEASAHAALPIRSCFWKRCGELRQAGLIAPTGEERKGDAGTPRIVCRITEAGKEWFR